MAIVIAVLAALQIVAGAGLLYHYVLLAAGGSRERALPRERSGSDRRKGGPRSAVWLSWPPRPAKADAGRLPRACGPEAGPEVRSHAAARHLAVVLPAHNEERVIGATVARLMASQYPAGRFDVHVAADYCSDRTAETARAGGAIVHERQEGPRGRKGYALAWVLPKLLASPAQYDAVVVFDADSRVAPDFLAIMDQELAGGARVVQGRHVIANPGDSALSALAEADMLLNNRLRNQAKANLGLSARLMGDGMCFTRAVLEAHPWSVASSLTEDREYGLYLATQGVRVAYAPEAVSTGEATARWRDATTQRLRWYGGVFEMQRRYVPALLRTAWRRRSLIALDHALELSLPSFSALAALSGALTLTTGALAALGLCGGVPAGVSLGLLAAAFLYPWLGLLAERAPRRSYRALLHGPAYALWRVSIGLAVSARRGKVRWVRTPRRGEAAAQQPAATEMRPACGKQEVAR